MTQTHKRYTREFKLEALSLARTSGKSIAQIERDLGLSQGLLYYWKRQFKADGEQAFPGNGKYDPLAILCTAPDECATDIIAWYMQRWCMEVTLEEARRHLGWRPSASGQTKPLPAPRPFCSVYSRG